MPEESSTSPDAGRFSLYDLLLAIIVIGTLGLTAELLLQEHIESWQQWIPLVLLGLGLAATAAVRIRPSPAGVKAFQAIMVAYLGAGLLGVYFHYAGNVEFALERTPELGGFSLIWEALRGATPALAPGAMVQLGLLGLAWAYRHPAATGTAVNHMSEANRFRRNASVRSHRGQEKQG